MQEDNRSSDRPLRPADSVIGRVLVVADAGPKSGLGHLARSSAVATALDLRGVEVRCVAHGATGKRTFDGVRWHPGDPHAIQSQTAVDAVDAVLLDSYELTEDSHASLGPVACFYDGNRPEPPAAARIVVAPASERLPRPGWLAGLSYACLRPAFWCSPPVEPSPTVGRVLVSTGATDPDGVSRRLVDAVHGALPNASVRRITGLASDAGGLPGVVDMSAPEDLRAELRGSDLVVCLGGQTALEAAALGLPTVAIALNANQASNVEQLASAGAVVAARLDAGLSDVIGALSLDADRRMKLSQAARGAVDGFGALRVAAEIELLIRAGA